MAEQCSLDSSPVALTPGDMLELWCACLNFHQAELCRDQSQRANEARRVSRWGVAVTLYRERLTALDGNAGDTWMT